MQIFSSVIFSFCKDISILLNTSNDKEYHRDSERVMRRFD